MSKQEKLKNINDYALVLDILVDEVEKGNITGTQFRRYRNET